MKPNFTYYIFYVILILFASCSIKEQREEISLEAYVGTHYFLPENIDISSVNMYDYEECYHQLIKGIDNMRSSF